VIKLLLMAAAPALVGVVAAGAAVLGVVSAQTAAPSHNPADQPLVTYGQR
jgi:hypothetical protein